MQGEKARWELHKNTMCYFEQIQEIRPNKTAAVQPLTSHYTNHPIKMNKTVGEIKTNILLIYTYIVFLPLHISFITKRFMYLQKIQSLDETSKQNWQELKDTEYSSHHAENDWIILEWKRKGEKKNPTFHYYKIHKKLILECGIESINCTKLLY